MKSCPTHLPGKQTPNTASKALPIHRFTYIVLAGFLGLAGCTPQLGEFTSIVNTRSAQEVPWTPPSARSRTSPDKAHKPQAKKPVVPETATISPGDLMNKSRDEISKLLGKPQFIRRDPPVEFWRYQDSSCVLEVFFYRRNNVPLLDHFEVRGLGRNQTSDSRCLNALIRGNTAANTNREPYLSPGRPAPRG